jgi:hypothetical protein
MRERGRIAVRGAGRILAVAAGVGIAAVLGSTAGARAAPQQLNCVLASTAQPAPNNPPVVVVFDDTAKTLQAKAGDQSYTFGNVSISNVAISGDVDDVSLGIDRSSLGMVWQQYGTDPVTIQYGQCRANPAPSSSQ